MTIYYSSIAKEQVYGKSYNVESESYYIKTMQDEQYEKVNIKRTYWLKKPQTGVGGSGFFLWEWVEVG